MIDRSISPRRSTSPPISNSSNPGPRSISSASAPMTNYRNYQRPQSGIGEGSALVTYGSPIHSFQHPDILIGAPVNGHGEWPEFNQLITEAVRLNERQRILHGNISHIRRRMNLRYAEERVGMILICFISYWLSVRTFIYLCYM